MELPCDHGRIFSCIRIRVLHVLYVLSQCATGYPVPANPANVFQSGSSQILLFWPVCSRIVSTGFK